MTATTALETIANYATGYEEASADLSPNQIRAFEEISDAAVAVLQSRGVTITADVILGMSAGVSIELALARAGRNMMRPLTGGVPEGAACLIPAILACRLLAGEIEP